ncbi:hypothetical protein [Campylobacter sp. MIT 97-5078]|uniref:hypothetical protein n=1 Tax=Campylobacter sp. MIT 97-5078 TaxID=1548153 RepID=UPI000514350E|nr:hypothetical protein [Campylobacter sp. MIT 97-5078]KGI55941.1 hypothetical protein LR59_09690 [Campylobacter sp. MIT 97-5078]TQR27811.1 hypothetical protein DMB91_02565 [Campylobacter sp. MIT 97-5078]
MKNADTLFLQLKEKVPSDSYLAFKQSLDEAEDYKFDALLLISYKNPILALIFSVIIPGVDRIYKGDVVLGVFKLIFVCVIYVAFNFYIDKAEIKVEIFIVLCVLAIIAFIWVASDIFLVYKGVKKDNLRKIFEVLQKKQ